VNLQAGPRNLEAARIRIAADKQLLAAMNRSLREAESPERKLLKAVDRVVKEGQS
jgi:hypothetical protein